MAIFITVCEYASVHSDGTMTMVRAGNDQWAPPSLPLNFGSFAVVQLEPGSLPAGKHTFSFSVEGPQGIVLASANGDIAITKSDAATRLPIPFQISVQSYGTVKLKFTIGELSARAEIKVVQPAAMPRN
jgi:hypothetical protein